MLTSHWRFPKVELAAGYLTQQLPAHVASVLPLSIIQQLLLGH